MSKRTGSIDKGKAEDIPYEPSRMVSVWHKPSEYDVLEKTLIGLSLYHEGQHPNAASVLIGLIATGQVAICPTGGLKRCRSTLTSLRYVRNQLRKMHNPLATSLSSVIRGYNLAAKALEEPVRVRRRPRYSELQRPGHSTRK